MAKERFNPRRNRDEDRARLRAAVRATEESGKRALMDRGTFTISDGVSAEVFIAAADTPIDEGDVRLCS